MCDLIRPQKSLRRGTLAQSREKFTNMRAMLLDELKMETHFGEAFRTLTDKSHPLFAPFSPLLEALTVRSLKKHHVKRKGA